MASSPSYVTQEGLQNVKEELDELRNVRRKEIAERIERAKEMGDLSENAEYSSARDEQAFLEGRILELEDLLRNAVVINHTKGSDFVEVGSVVTVQSEDALTREYTIVGSNEAAPLKGKISHQSPLGEAFLGKRVNDVVEVHAPKGVIRYTILGIE
ncbi:MAG: transcription elongation factor GreA [bacterium]|nr:transcription elongation factor GreA [bacterium]